MANGRYSFLIFITLEEQPHGDDAPSDRALSLSFSLPSYCNCFTLLLWAKRVVERPDVSITTQRVTIYTAMLLGAYIYIHYSSFSLSTLSLYIPYSQIATLAIEFVVLFFWVREQTSISSLPNNAR